MKKKNCMSKIAASEFAWSHQDLGLKTIATCRIYFCFGLYLKESIYFLICPSFFTERQVLDYDLFMTATKCRTTFNR